VSGLQEDDILPQQQLEVVLTTHLTHATSVLLTQRREVQTKMHKTSVLNSRQSTMQLRDRTQKSVLKPPQPCWCFRPKSCCIPWL